MSPNIPTGGRHALCPPKLTSQCMLFSSLISLYSINCKSSTHNAPKLAFLSSKIENFLGRGHRLPTPYSLPPSAPLGASILAFTALDTRAFGARPPISNTNRRHRFYDPLESKGNRRR